MATLGFSLSPLKDHFTTVVLVVTAVGAVVRSEIVRKILRSVFERPRTSSIVIRGTINGAEVVREFSVDPKAEAEALEAFIRDLNSRDHGSAVKQDPADPV